MKLPLPGKKTLAVTGVLGGIGAGAVVYDRMRPVSIPARGGILRMRKATLKSIQSKARRGDQLAMIGQVRHGLQTGKIKYYRYPKGSASLMRMPKHASLLKRVKPNIEALIARRTASKARKATALAKRGNPGLYDRFFDHVEKHPALTIPITAGTMAATGYGAIKLKNAVRDARYRRDVQRGAYPSGYSR